MFNLPGGYSDTTTRIAKKHPRERLGLRIHTHPGRQGCVIIAVLPGSPGARAGGIIEGNTIVAIEGRSVVGLSHPEVVAALQRAGNNFLITVASGSPQPKTPERPDKSETSPPPGLVDRLYSGLSPAAKSGDGRGASPAKAKGRAEKVDTRWAALLQVSLPAEYVCIGVSRKDGNPLACAVHLEPKITAEKISLLQPDEYVTVIASKWDWMLVDGTRSGMNVHGWVHAGAGQAKYLRPIPPQEFPWQRARGTGVYSNVLAHRKSELRELDLALDPGLLQEWMAVVADLDVALRIRAQVDARGCALRATMSGRPRSRSFNNTLLRLPGMPAPSDAGPAPTGTSRLRRPRSMSFAGNAGTPPEPTPRFPGDEGVDVPAVGTSPMHHTGIRERWRAIQKEKNQIAFDSKHRQWGGATLKEKGWRRGGLQRGREARCRAEQVNVATAKRRAPELTVASADVGFASTTPIDLDFGGPNGADGEARPGLSQSWRNGMSQRLSGSLDAPASAGGSADPSQPNWEGGKDRAGAGDGKPAAGDCFDGIHLPTAGSRWRLSSSPSPRPKPLEDDRGGSFDGVDDEPSAHHGDASTGFIDDEYGESSTPLMGIPDGLASGVPNDNDALGELGPDLFGPDGITGGDDADDLAAWQRSDTVAHGDAGGGLHGPGFGAGLDDPVDDDPIEIGTGPFTEM